MNVDIPSEEKRFFDTLKRNSLDYPYQLVVRCKVCGKVLLCGSKTMAGLLREFYSNTWDTWKEEVRCPECVKKQGWPALIAAWKNLPTTDSAWTATPSGPNSSATSKPRTGKPTPRKPAKRSARASSPTSKKKPSTKKPTKRK